jgi:hypothetical protein
VIILRALSVASIALCVLVARYRSRHRHIAWALAVALVASMLRTELRGVAGAERASMALLAVSPMAGAYAAMTGLRALRPLLALALSAAIWVAFAAMSFSLDIEFWLQIPVVAHAAGLALAGLACIRWGWRGEPVTVTERTLLVLLAGDVAMFLAPLLVRGPWALAQIAAGGVSLAVCAMQLDELISARGSPSAPATTRGDDPRASRVPSVPGRRGARYPR